ncbi:radical SAM protein [Nocardiopsis sp. CNR-923]|uniref:cyclophane-forming radical SAM peptide maturase AmcB n=1 Tax=Nocardiopsis sp. CNR-923 TaxID=1904965 RepID=UPI00096354D0|nr:cyclophane-forming radical SAM peptide maturase AmcB [Nocardiopsis sp. CNR-923]OLT26312.1 radical SAM protein [Nocardiopsis sp. CNR-923]
MALGSRFRTLVLQPTALCNLNCEYCYIRASERKTRREMALPVVEALAASVAEQGESVDLVWHGGEPLTVRPEHFSKMCDIFEPLRREGKVTHFVQTNATTIDDRWCGFFQRYGFNVGVSLDGPAVANSQRVDWSGRETFTRTMRGINTLKRNGLGFSVICVVTRETVKNPDSLFEFFEGLDAESVGFNIEEEEGSNNDRETAPLDEVRAFWRALFDRINSSSPLHSREARRLFGYLSDVKAGNRQRWTSAKIDPIPAVSWDGNVVLLSPELLGVKAPKYGDFIVGNVLRESISNMLGRAHTVPYIQEFISGVQNCRESCDFFTFCQGGQAGNRYFELEDFTATETNYCRQSKQQLVLALNDHVKENHERP